MTQVSLRPVEDGDIPVFFEHQVDPEAVAMAAFPAREEERFTAHWAKIRGDADNVLRTLTVDGEVAGNLLCWPDGDQRLVGYWLGRGFWGRGVATRALELFVEELTIRPLHAHVAVHNLGSIRVLEKCGFRRDRAQETGTPPPGDGVEELVYVLS